MKKRVRILQSFSSFEKKYLKTNYKDCIKKDFTV